MNTGLEGKIAMVSGASKGIGKAVALALAAEGASLSLAARSESLLEHLAVEVEKQHGVPCLACGADLSEGAEITRWVARTTERFGGVDILVNNAGAVQGGPFLDMPDEAWLDSWRLKLFGYIRVARAVFPHLMRRGGGRIVNVIGIGGAANAALLNFTKALANEGAPHGILVNGVNPGPIATERWESMIKKWGESKGVSPTQVETELLAEVHLKRAGTSDEVANAVVFLASPLASYITGVTVAVDGGMTRTI